MNDNAGQNDGVGKAQAEVAAARARLLDTAHQLQRRLRPDELAREALEGVKIRSAEFAGEAVAAARARPVVSAGAAAGLLALLLRRPIGRLTRRLFDHGNETGN